MSPPRQAHDRPGADSDRSTVEAAVHAADLRVLVMSLFHLTGDETWLEPPFRPARDTQLIADPNAGFEPAARDHIRSTAIRVLQTADDRSPVIERPDPALFQTMMSVCLGEDVPEEYVEMLLADFGFEQSRPVWSADRHETPNIDVLIIGAGASGLCLAADLERLGIEYSILEKNEDVGGTWYENRYPGCGVDTPNHFYSYSFAPNSRWSRYFSLRDELHQYLQKCAKDFDVHKRIRLGQTVTDARWDDHQSKWKVTARTPDGDEVGFEAHVLVPATGHFNHPTVAQLPGLDTFSGETFHSARWPDAVVTDNKRVAVIGTGASAVQIVPTVAADAEHVTVFQRTPQWVRPVTQYNASVDPNSQWLFDNVPYYTQWYRFTQLWRYGDGLLQFLRKDPDWPYPERAVNRINDRHRQEMTDYLAQQLEGRPDLLEQCVPDYPPFAKRILIDNDWYRTLRRSNVELVTSPINRVEGSGIRTTDGRLIPIDVIVMATGFNVTNLAAHINVIGRDGRTLADDWSDDNPTAYLGICVPTFPNMFLMYGPNTNMGHGGSGMWLAETQSRYIAGWIISMIEQGFRSVEIGEDARADYTDLVDTLHDQLIWTHPGVSTYYRNANGQVRSPMPFRLVDYWHLTKHPSQDGFLIR